MTPLPNTDEQLEATLQSDLVRALKDEEVASVFAQLEPDDRVSLLDELPASVANRLMRGLSPTERDLTAAVLGYPAGSIGRRMSPEYVAAREEMTVARALELIRSRLADAETIYSVPVVDGERRLVGIVSLRDLMGADPDTTVADIRRPAHSAQATSSAEAAARRCADLKVLAMPVVDTEDRLVGILTVDDALAILEDAESEDQARMAGSEPLRRGSCTGPRSASSWV